MPEGRTYTIRNSRLAEARKKNMSVSGDMLVMGKQTRRYCFFPAIDSAVEDCPWGRLHLTSFMEGRLHLEIRVMTSNQKEILWKDGRADVDALLCGNILTDDEKLQFMETAGGIREENKEDILLYRLTGRYLWLAVSVEGEGTGRIECIRIYQKGDNFMDTFPEIYRERNSFFHRYISIFSAIYNDFQWDIEHIHRNFMPDTAPKELLPVLAEWLGLNLRGDFLDEDIMRELVKHAYELNKIKGTKKAMEQVIQIVLGEQAVILEKNKGAGYHGQKLKEECDITILIKTQVEQKKKARLMFLLEQFKPMGCTMKIVFLKRGGQMDGHTYMDMNAMIVDGKKGYLDQGQTGQNIILS